MKGYIFDSLVINLKQGILQKVAVKESHIAEVYFCYSKQLSLAVIQNVLFII